MAVSNGNPAARAASAAGLTKSQPTALSQAEAFADWCRAEEVSPHDTVFVEALSVDMANLLREVPLTSILKLRRSGR